MREYFSAMLWLAKVMVSLVASHPVTMLLGVVLSLVGHVTHLLAFLLPLKVILLAGSEGVPSYFQMIVAPDQKSAAIALLSLGAALSYGLSLFLGNVVKRLSSIAGARISESSNAIYIVSNQGDETRNVVLQFMELAASLLFVGLALAILGWLSPILFVCIAGAILVSAAFLGLTATPRVGHGPKSPREIAATLKVLAAIAFFVCFAVLLLPFLLGAPGGSVLIAIISFVLLRQLLNRLPSAVRQAIKLASNRPLISALVFRHHQFRRDESGVGRSFREAFERDAHLVRLREELGDEIPPGAELDLRWVDSANREFQTFEIVARAPGSPDTLYLERVVLPGREIFAENEHFLFEHVPREALNAPPLVARYKEGSFDSLVSRIGRIDPNPSATPDLVGMLLEHSWSLEPPAELKNAYSVSHPLLPARLNEQLVARCAVAVDTADERRTFEIFCERLERLRRFLRSAPLYIHNPHLQESRIYRLESGDLLMPSWGLWSLEPIGTMLPDSDGERLGTRLAHARQLRASIPVDFGVGEVRLVNSAVRLEKQIGMNRFKQALAIMSSIIMADSIQRGLLR